MKINDNNFDCANITDQNISARTEEKQSGNKYDKNYNCERNLSVNNKSADENMRELNKENTI